MKDQKTIAQLLDYIEENLEKQLSLDEIAEKAGYSKFHLNRMFMECVGLTLCKYIQMRRLTIAAEKLIYTGKEIIDIAYEANYSSQQSFTLAFRQLYDCPPQQYRIMKIHTPKRSRFKITNTGMVRRHSYRNGEVMAA